MADDRKIESVSLDVMTFNIEWGGTGISFDKVVQTIETSGADVVGIQEAEGNMGRLAEALGWHYDRRSYVISRYPLLDPPGAKGRYVFIESQPGRVFAITSLHLPSDPYGPEAIRDGADLQEVIALEARIRVPALQPFLRSLAALQQDGIPVVVTGDFNAPSDGDWTVDLVGLRPQMLYPVAWPTSVMMRKAGFKDAWRSIHPDSRERPGLTWFAGRPPNEAYNPGDDAPHDRIDFIWYAGDIEAVDARLIGEVGAAGVSTTINPWPSDHRAVVAKLKIRSAPMPPLITTERRVYLERDSIRIIGNFPDADRVSLNIVAAGGNMSPVRTEIPSNNIDMDIAAPKPGAYIITAIADGRHYRREFWVLSHNATPAVSVDASGSAGDCQLQVRWSDAPGHRNDYLALYDIDETELYDGQLGHAYIDATPHGEIACFERSISSRQSIAPGKYLLRLMKDDGYEPLAVSNPFTVH